MNNTRKNEAWASGNIARANLCPACGAFIGSSDSDEVRAIQLEKHKRVSAFNGHPCSGIEAMAPRDKIICSRCGIYTSTEQAGGTLCERCRYPDPGEGPDVGDSVAAVSGHGERFEVTEYYEAERVGQNVMAALLGTGYREVGGEA